MQAFPSEAEAALTYVCTERLPVAPPADSAVTAAWDLFRLQGRPSQRNLRAENRNEACATAHLPPLSEETFVWQQNASQYYSLSRMELHCSFLSQFLAKR
ncbi:unnamed protein product [Polarella glacialis]|uniref:Uncharacterized protein n=1 Tax=Polarella glacialis TaxID=89957 RepID=A0A813KRP8_POLGL|nr:unnamed protein product [Polarella glacialis]